jgi:hypothetical protein
MFRYKLRTLLILLAVLPPIIWVCWYAYAELTKLRYRVESLPPHAAPVMPT